MIKQFDSWPIELDRCGVSDLHRILGGPALIELKGRRPEPLFVSTLLHGNEHSGFKALQRLMRETQGQTLPRTMLIFIGNTAAAAKNLRLIPGELDYNRIWSGGEGSTFEAASWLLGHLTEAKIFASVDIHDNTGWNPHYACVSKIDGPTLQLANMFNHIAIHSTHPDTTLTNNISKLAPAVTLECGRVDDPFGADRALNFLRAVLHLSDLPHYYPHGNDLKLFCAVGRILIDKEAVITIGTEEPPANGISLRSDLDHLNFTTLKPGEVLGKCLSIQPIIEDFSEETPEQDISKREKFLMVKDGQLVVAKDFVPAMLTISIEAIKDDCLGYFMQEMEWPGSK